MTPAGEDARSDRSREVTDEVAALAGALVALGRRVRDRVRDVLRLAAAEPGGEAVDAVDAGAALAAVVRRGGGDDIFGIDAVADEVILSGLAELARWPGRWVMEGFDEALPVGRDGGPWRYLCDPLDGTRPLLAAKRSAWMLVGAGRGAATLEDLEVSVVVEVPTLRAAVGTVAWADRAGRLVAVDDVLAGPPGPPRPVRLRPRRSAVVDHGFVTVVRFAPGAAGAIGRWQDDHLAGLVTFDDLVPCTAGQLMGLAGGSDVAVFDPRPLLAPGTMAAHPYDLAGLLVARAAGAIVEALPAGPLSVPLDVATPVAWAGYANDAVAARLRVRTWPGAVPG